MISQAALALLQEITPAWATLELLENESEPITVISVFVARIMSYPADCLILVAGDEIMVLGCLGHLGRTTTRWSIQLADPEFPEKVWDTIRHEFHREILLWAGITPTGWEQDRRGKP